MNPIIQFYSDVWKYVQSEVRKESDVEKILEVASRLHPTWKASREALDHIIGDGFEDEVWGKANENFAKAAFKDLSVLKNPLAMKLYHRLHAENPMLGKDYDLMWARTIKARPDGSAVIVLHVSNLQKFREYVEHHFFTQRDERKLEDVVDFENPPPGWRKKFFSERR